MIEYTQNFSAFMYSCLLRSLLTLLADVTLYDIHAATGLNKRRGDFVILHPPAAEGMDINTSERIDWFGEVIDLGRDGFLTVRLGALDDVRDIRISPEYATIVYSSDGAPGFDSEDDSEDDSESDSDEEVFEDDYDSDDYPWLTNDGIPVSDVEAEGWSTASSDSDEAMPGLDNENMPDLMDQDLAMEDIMDMTMVSEDDVVRSGVSVETGMSLKLSYSLLTVSGNDLKRDCWNCITIELNMSILY
jgi:hypothetical protein